MFYWIFAKYRTPSQILFIQHIVERLHFRIDAENESFELAKLTLIQYFYIQGRDSYNYCTVGIWKFGIYSLTLINQIQTNMARGTLLLCVYVYDIRYRMKPSLVGKIFIVLKLSEKVL